MSHTHAYTSMGERERKRIREICVPIHQTQMRLAWKSIIEFIRTIYKYNRFWSAIGYKSICMPLVNEFDSLFFIFTYFVGRLRYLCIDFRWRAFDGERCRIGNNYTSLMKILRKLLYQHWKIFNNEPKKREIETIGAFNNIPSHSYFVVLCSRIQWNEAVRIWLQ